MAGVKGRSGGARPGAGRKPRTKKEASAGGSAVKTELEPQAHGGALKRDRAEPVPQGDKDMLTLLQEVALGKTDATALQVRAAIAAVQYTHTKKHDGGKKDEAAERAKKAATGRFAAAPAPLALVKR
jgi:hypothetical protein